MAEPKCPICGAEMVIRQARRGPNKGKKFYGCSNYFITKCKGTIDLEEVNSISKYGEIEEINIEQDIFETNHYMPTQIIAQPYYTGFEVSFHQSIAIPYELLQMINHEEISSKELRKYSQWRVEYCINNKTQLDSSIRDVFNLMQKLLTRGTLTLLSEKLESKLENLYNVDDYKDFSLDCFVVHNQVGKKRNIDFGSSLYEKEFYNEALPILLGEYYQYYTLTQVSIESLIDGLKVTESFEQSRVDFLVTTNQNSYVIELDGEEHLQHKDRDNARDEKLTQAGYKVIRISNESDFISAIKEIPIDKDGHIRYSKRNLSNMEKYILSSKLSHQIMIALIEALLKGYDFYNNNVVYLNFSSEIIVGIEKEDLCSAIQNEFNELLLHVARLFKLDKNFIPFEFKPYYKDTNELIISFDESCIDMPNNMIISDIFINKVIASPSMKSTLRYYDLPEEEDLEYFLNYLFRKNKFREGQFETISRGLQGKDTLVLLPTGSGKSIAFQLTSMLLNGVTLVIDPIIALINDQIENLNRIGIDRVAGITSLISDHQSREKTLKAFSMGDYMITYISPERLQSQEFRDAIQGLTTITPIPLVAIDEAHCVSEWGHDFRTSYLNIGRISREYGGEGYKSPCIIGLTGTASNTVLRDVQRELDIKDFDAIITPKTFDRKELSYDIFQSPSKGKENILINLLDRYFPGFFMRNSSSFYSQNGDSTKCGLIFCPHVDGDFGVKNVADFLKKERNLPVNIYSGKKPKRVECINWNNEKSKVARDFKNNKFNLMVATKAFGMGIDKANINYTIHYGLPTSIESFYQEAGRAGRNGEPSKCVLMVSNDNQERSQKLLDPKRSINELRTIMDSEVNFENDDDISRVIFFHLNSFKGIDEEIKSVRFLLDKIDDLEISRKIIIKANKDFNRSVIEKALYRLIVLGPVTDYTINYSSDEFTFDYHMMDRDEIIDRYAEYVAGYNITRMNKETAKLQEVFEFAYKDFLIEASKTLINFIYDTIEKGRRRGISEVLMLAEAALKANNPDEVIRNRILRYLETTYSEEIEKILNVEELKLEYISDLIDGYETSDGRIIGGLRSPKDAEEIRGQVSRYLESRPDHPGLLILRAISEMFCSDYNKTIVLSTLETAIKYANEQVGYSIYANEFYKMIAWSTVKIGERDIEIYTELIKELLDRFKNIQFAKYILHFSANDKRFMMLPTQFIIETNCVRINQIIRRKNNVRA